MPKTTKSGKVDQEELPSTLQRSDAKAQRTFAKAHDSAAEQYGDEERAHRVAFSALNQAVTARSRWTARARPSLSSTNVPPGTAGRVTRQLGQ
jgi:hypothetical protein